MYFKAAVIFSLAASALALPTGQGKTQKRAGVLTPSSYADFQVSDGVGGNALAEVNAKFPIDTSDLANVDPDDLAIIKAARVTAEDAETDSGGFNDAIDAASGDEADALSVGKIKNKVLKLQLEVLGLQIDQAQSGEDNSDKIAEEQTKLNTNIANDKENAGKTSQSVDFQGTSDPE